MATLEQTRARSAYDHVNTFTPQSPEAKKYGTMVHKLPALIQAAGLCQALHFVQSRGNDDQKKLLDHLAEQLRRVDAKIADSGALLRRVREAELGVYLRLTHEALACAGWYRRMVQGVLKVDPGDAPEAV